MEPRRAWYESRPFQNRRCDGFHPSGGAARHVTCCEITLPAGRDGISSTGGGSPSHEQGIGTEPRYRRHRVMVQSGMPGHSRMRSCRPTEAHANPRRSRMPELPHGTVTFLFTDIEGSTALWERDRAAMREAVARQLAILQSLIAAHHGVLYKTIGDGTQAAFASAEDALRAAVAAQRALLAGAWSDPPWTAAGAHGAACRGSGAGCAGGLPGGAPQSARAAPGHRSWRPDPAHPGGAATRPAARLPQGPRCATWGSIGCATCWSQSGSSSWCTRTCPPTFRPSRVLDARPTNLPRQPTPFIGREHEVAEVVAPAAPARTCSC